MHIKALCMFQAVVVLRNVEDARVGPRVVGAAAGHGGAAPCTTYNAHSSTPTATAPALRYS